MQSLPSKDDAHSIANTALALICSDRIHIARGMNRRIWRIARVRSHPRTLPCRLWSNPNRNTETGRAVDGADNGR